MPQGILEEEEQVTLDKITSAIKCHRLQILFLNPVAPFTGWEWDGGDAAAPVSPSQIKVMKVIHVFLWFRKTNSNHDKPSASCHIKY